MAKVNPPQAPRTTAAPAAATAADLVNLSQAVETVSAEATSVDTQLTQARAELASAPPSKKAALQEKVKALSKKLEEANGKVDAASGRLTTAMTSLDGKGKARDKAGQTYQSYQALEGLKETRSQEVASLTKTVAKLKASRSPDLAAAQQKLAKATSGLDAVEGAMAVVANHLEKLEGQALGDSMYAGETTGSVSGTSSDRNQATVHDRLVDIASMTPENQTRLLGAPVVEVSRDKAASNDRKMVSQASKNSTDASATMLAMQLDGADETQQVMLVKLASGDGGKANHISAMVKAANESTGTAMGLVKALKTAKGPARERLMDAIVNGITSPNSELLRAVGGDFALTAELRQALLAKDSTADMKGSALRSQCADKLTANAASSMKSARAEFESAKKQAEALDGEFGRIVFGFGAAFPQDKLEAYRAKFKQDHQAEYAAYDRAAKNYLPAFEAAQERVFPTPKKGLSEADANLQAELTKAIANGHALLTSPQGQQELAEALKLQALEKPNLLDRLAKSTGTGNKVLKLPEQVAGALTQAMVKYATVGGGDLKKLGRLLETNKELLGLEKEGLAEFKKAFDECNLPPEVLGPAERLAKQEAAVKQIKAGAYGGTAVKALGVLLTGPSIVKGWSEFGKGNNLERLETIAKTGEFAKDIGELVLKDSAVLTAIGTGLKTAGAALSIAKGFSEMYGGKNVDGAMDIYAGLGGAMMLIPGGQAFGAVLVIGSAIAKHIWGEDPAADLEKKTEAEVKDFLLFMGLKPEAAEELSDVLQKDLRNVGSVIPQMSKALGVTPGEFMDYLSGLKKDQLHAFVKMVKEMPTNDEWQYTEKRTGNTDSSKLLGYGPAGYLGPQSIESAIKWMKENGMPPPQRK